MCYVKNGERRSSHEPYPPLLGVIGHNTARTSCKFNFTPPCNHAPPVIVPAMQTSQLHRIPLVNACTNVRDVLADAMPIAVPGLATTPPCTAMKTIKSDLPRPQKKREGTRLFSHSATSSSHSTQIHACMIPGIHSHCAQNVALPSPKIPLRRLRFARKLCDSFSRIFRTSVQAYLRALDLAGEKGHDRGSRT